MNCFNCNYKGVKYVCKQCRKGVGLGFTFSSTYVESTVGNEPLAEKKSQGLYQKCSIHVHHRTNKLSDPDGRSLKACIDGLTVAGILPDDSAKFIEEITQSQEVVKGGEETVIRIKIQEMRPEERR